METQRREHEDDTMNNEVIEVCTDMSGSGEQLKINGPSLLLVDDRHIS